MSEIAFERENLIALLMRWKAGTLGAADVQEEAEKLLETRINANELPREDDQSIPAEILLYLDALPALLVTKSDIGAMVDFLNTPKGAAIDGWHRWLAYWDRLDKQQREKEVKGDPFYFT